MSTKFNATHLPPPPPSLPVVEEEEEKASTVTETEESDLNAVIHDNNDNSNIYIY